MLESHEMFPHFNIAWVFSALLTYESYGKYHARRWQLKWHAPFWKLADFSETDTASSKTIKTPQKSVPRINFKAVYYGHKTLIAQIIAYYNLHRVSQKISIN